MKIVIISPAYPLRGGIANFTSQLYHEVSKNHEVIIFNYKRQYPKLFFPGKTQFENDEAVDKLDSRIEIDSINPFNWKKIATNIISIKPQIVIFVYWMPFFAPCLGSIAKKLKKNYNAKLLAICHNIIPHEKKPGDNFLSRLFFNKIDYFILLSKNIEKDLRRFVLNPRFKILSHPVYTRFGNCIEKSEAKNYLKLKKEKYLLFFGFIRDYKGLDVLLSALSKIDDKKVNLIIAGEFYSNKDKYLKLIDDLNLQNRVLLFSDFIPTKDVKYYFCASDAVILPYKSATQSGIVQIAVNFNKPVIATNVGGLGEVILDGENGYIVEKENPVALADAIRKFYLEDKEKIFVENISKITYKYSWKYFVDGIFELINP